MPEAAGNFMKETNVLPIEIKGVKVDLVFAQLPFEIEAISSARDIEFSNISMKVCGVEDFIIHKAISQRKKDWLDIEVVIEKKIKELDWKYLLKHLKDLSTWLDDPEIYERVLKMKK